MTRDQIIDAFLIPLAWEPVNGDQKSAWPYAVTPAFHNGEWFAFRYGVALDGEDERVARFPTEAAAIAACEADHRAEAVKTWDIAKIEALVGAAMAQEAWEAEVILNADWSRGTVLLRQEDHDALTEVQAKRNAALATIRGRT